MCTLYLVLINSPFSTALLLLLVLFTLCLTVSAITGCGIWPIYTMQFFRLLSRGKILKLEPGILMFTFVSSTADYFQVLRTLVLFCNAFLSHISPNVNNANNNSRNSERMKTIHLLIWSDNISFLDFKIWHCTVITNPLFEPNQRNISFEW